MFLAPFRIPVRNSSPCDEGQNTSFSSPPELLVVQLQLPLVSCETRGRLFGTILPQSRRSWYPDFSRRCQEQLKSQANG